MTNATSVRVNAADPHTKEVQGSNSPSEQGECDQPATHRRRPGVRVLLALIVAVPTVSVGVLAGADARSAWTSRQDAQAVAHDAITLQKIALARLELNDALIPITAVSYANHIGVSETTLSSVLKLNVPGLLRTTIPRIRSDPTFRTSDALRESSANWLAAVPKVENDTITFDAESALTDKVAGEIDTLWYRDFSRLQDDVAVWQPPGSFETHVAALRQVYEAFDAGEFEVEGAMYVLQGQGSVQVDTTANSTASMSAAEAAIENSGNFAVAVDQFGGDLGPLAEAQWRSIQVNSSDRSLAGIVQQGVGIALNGGTAPFQVDPTKAGPAALESIKFVGDLGNLVQDASLDLYDSATSRASAATAQLVGEVAFLVFLLLVTFGSVLVAANKLTRPMKRLAVAASQVRTGEFGLDRLRLSGPREVVATTTAFNEMAATLTAVEAKTMALATEDLSDPELKLPLPGRTGNALQAAVDGLAAQIAAREVRRRQLQYEATHDRLTGLINRAAVFDYLTTEVSRRRHAGETVAVLFVDLDHLKPLNDEYGHEAGDTAIKATGEAITEATGECDVIARLGGDEFLAVLCPEHSADAALVESGIRSAVARRSVLAGSLIVPLRCSIGVALAECDEDTDPMDLVRQADEAMYEAKKRAHATRDQRDQRGAAAAAAAASDAGQTGTPTAPNWERT